MGDGHTVEVRDVMTDRMLVSVETSSCGVIPNVGHMILIKDTVVGRVTLVAHDFHSEGITTTIYVEKEAK